MATKIQNQEKSNDQHNYIFFLSLVDIKAPLPFEIIPNHFIERAKPSQINVIKNFLKEYGIILPVIYAYEKSQVQAIPRENGDIEYQSELLPPEKWKYWVISYKGRSKEIQHLQNATLLLKEQIEFGPEFRLNNELSLRMSNFPATLSYLTSNEVIHSIQPTAQISTDDLKNIQLYYSLIKGLKQEYSYIINAINLLNELRALPRESDFISIGLFSIIESLLSHNPKLDYFHDSIKHQIKTKIPLLKKRFVRMLDYGEYFKNGVKEEKILSNLYDYRSAIVHAGNSAIPNDLSSILIGKDEVRKFLVELTKLLIITALMEPELVTDLKSC